ncbi:uncharacterized protein PV09_06055 [Verruconis gallopava]|uniref:Heterokaryon incompatibility domain-containing protein n=1 Tax=Verruconis gallopava TaxID=253628 RepID=A0A0D1YPR2_9PEZI|nr:uncharacterized protein PV09_06055 [Verruconis gallopava]KIW02607.1 hypothetical protein PV09_06055 [Verruconis gallopava]
MPFIDLSKPKQIQEEDATTAIDVVAIHGLYEDAISTWTERQGNVLWLRDIYPHRATKTRILLYSYDASALAAPGEGSSDRLLSCATTLIAELCSQRSDAHTRKRPIIFICHGIGGLLVKRALAFSCMRRSPRVEHQRSIYLSTYAILFMGTPHKGMKKRSILMTKKREMSGSNEFMMNLREGSEMINEIGDVFASILNDFCIFNFWEEIKTTSENSAEYIVEEDSAAPLWENVERCGIFANHSGLVKFGNAENYGYQLVQDALKSEDRMNQTLRLDYDTERNQPSLANVPTNHAFARDINKWFLVERQPTRFFTGREACARDVKHKFSEAQRQVGRKNHAIFAIYGLGGSGKTQFCLKYVHDNRLRYWGIFWIDASTTENAEASFAKIDQQVRDGSNHSKEGSCSAAMHWLLQCKKPWLIVLDNADDPDMDLSRFIPAGSHGHILITTRNPSVVDYATVGHVKFQGMDPEEAISLLLRTAKVMDQTESPNPRSRSLAQCIASELGYLALPLAQAGATIRRKIYSLERYLHHYLGHRKAMSYRETRSIDDTNIITTWEIPFQRIASRPSVEYRNAVDLLHIFAFMHFESIPEEIFQRAWNEIEESQAYSNRFPEILRPDSSEDFQARLRSAIQVLSSYSLVDHELKTRAFMLHPVIHAWARERLSDKDQRKWFDCAMSVLASSISSKLEASGRRFRQLLIPHMDACLKTLKQQRPQFPETIERAADVEKFAWVYAENGMWEKARDLQVLVVNFRSRHLGRCHEATLSAKRHLGSTYWNLFDLKPLIILQMWMLLALWFIRPTLSCWLTLTPWKPDHVAYCLALDDLTQSLWLVGQRERSKRVGERAVNGLIKHLGREDPKTLNAMFNLARTYLHLGEYQKSSEMLVYVLKMRKRFFGMNHLDTLMVKNEYGVLLCAQKKYLAVAERLVSNVLKSRKEMLGEEHAYTLWSVNDLSKVLCERGRPAEAAVMLKRIIPIVSRTLGDNHAGMSMTKGNLARALALCGEWVSAEKVLGPLLNAMPAEHPDWIHAKYGYIRIQARLGQSDEVERSCNALLDQIAKGKILSLDNPRTTAIAEELFKVYRAKNRLAEIRALKKRIPSLDENNFIGDEFDVYAIRKSSQPTMHANNGAQRAGELSSDANDTIPNTGQPSIPNYKYSPLPTESSFRVLELLPGEKNADLAFRLHLEDWSKSPVYEALSYAWGDSKNKVPTLCDEQPLYITTNLRDGLIHLRQSDRSRFLWADAICIDQNNLEERGQQVSIMRQIYANATKVVVWLGKDEDGEAAKAAQFMQTLAISLCRRLPNELRDMKAMDDLYSLTDNAAFTDDKSAWLSVAWYFSRAWFQRLWVFQEVNSGPNVDVICGTSHLSWDVVGLAATYIKRWPAVREHISNIHEGFWYNAYIMRSRHHQSTISAASMLLQGQNFVASDPLDKVYALLGTRPLRKWESSLQPDYKRSRQSLYWEIAKRCLVEDKDPFLLSCAQHNRGVNLEDFPSWIPQWDQERVRVPIAMQKAGWNASSDSALFAEIQGNDAILELQGVVLDTILSEYELDPDVLFNENEHSSVLGNPTDHSLLKLWREQRDLVFSLYPSTKQLAKAFASTFVLGYRINYDEEYRERLMADFSAHVIRLVQLCAQDSRQYAEMADEAPNGDWKNYLHEAHSMSYRRAFIRTTKGYMGLVPNATQVGDSVCIIFGCKVPYILRKINGHHFLVGDAYIHDVMDGQAMELDF